MDEATDGKKGEKKNYTTEIEWIWECNDISFIVHWFGIGCIITDTSILLVEKGKSLIKNYIHLTTWLSMNDNGCWLCTWNMNHFFFLFHFSSLFIRHSPGFTWTALLLLYFRSHKYRNIRETSSHTKTQKPTLPYIAGFFNWFLCFSWLNFYLSYFFPELLLVP